MLDQDNKEMLASQKILKNNQKRNIYLTFFVLLALYLSIAETFIPKPFPWLKIGLANIVTLVALEKYDFKMAVEVTVLRIVIQNIALGTIFAPGFIISIISGSFSVIVMGVLYKGRKYFSLISISIAAAFVHNLIQLIVVYFLMFRNISIVSRPVFLFIIIFLGIGIICGSVTGLICERSKIRKISQVQ